MIEKYVQKILLLSLLILKYEMRSKMLIMLLNLLIRGKEVEMFSVYISSSIPLFI